MSVKHRLTRLEQRLNHNDEAGAEIAARLERGRQRLEAAGYVIDRSPPPPKRGLSLVERLIEGRLRNAKH